MALVVTAIHTFVAEHSDELEFTAGEKITIIEKDDAFGDGWWKGRNEKGDEGLFPATYISEEPVDVLAPPPPVDGTAAATAAPDATAALAAGSAGTATATTAGGVAAAVPPAIPEAAENSRSGSPIPVPPSPKAAEMIKAVTPPPTAPDANTPNGGLASPFSPPTADDGANRNSLLDITGQPHSAPGVAVAAGSRGNNVMGSTIGEVQEAIDTMGTTSPNVPKGVQLKDPQEAAAAAALSDDKDEDDYATAPIGIASDARARLAEQAKLANEERDRQQQRDSGAIADLIYSDESDDEEGHSPNSLNRSVKGLSLNGNGTAANGTAQTQTAPEKTLDSTPIASPTTATWGAGLKPGGGVGSNEATPRGPGVAPGAAPGVSSPRAQGAALDQPLSPTEATARKESSERFPVGAAGAAMGAAAVGAGAAAYSHSRNVSNASDVPIVGKRTSSMTGGSPALGSQARLEGHGYPPSDISPAPNAATTAFPTSGSVDASSIRSGQTSAKPPASWTVDEVVEWARGKGFDENICSKFVEHDISGDVLLELDASTLKELDIPQFGKRVRIATAINELKRPTSSMSGASPHPQGEQQQGAGGATRTFSAPPSSYTHSSGSSPVVDDTHGAWGHGRKVSMTPSTPAIDEATALTSPTNGTGNGQPRTTTSLPVSPATGPTSAAAAAATAATMATLSKRESTSSLGGHKKKSSVDKTDRLSFFGRSRKPPPMPAPASQSSSRAPFHNKPTTTMTAAAPERRTSSGAGTTANVGSALRTIGTPDKTGYLKKRGERYNTWKLRFFVLKGSYLYYLKSESEDRVKGRIDLKGHRIIVDENTNPGSYGFRLVGPGNEKPHFFSSSEQGQIRDWMKALMKATIARDYTVPVTSSCNIPTIPLAEAQALQPRPPSPSQIDATQRANRRENVNQLTPRDASVLMSLDTTSSGRRMTSHSSLGQTPSRPSRDTRRASTSRGSAGRPSIASYYPPEDEHHAELMAWVNQVLPPQYPRAAYFPNSFISGEVIFLIVKHLSGIEPNPPLPPSAFSRDSTGQPNVEGLFAMMDCVIDAGIDSAGVSLNEIRAGDANAVATLLNSVRTWARARGIA